MKLRKNVIECTIVAVAMITITAITAVVTPDYTEKEVTSEIETESAGDMADVSEDFGEGAAEVASIQRSDAVMVSEAAPELTEEEKLWRTRLIADVEEFLYIRSEPNDGASVKGKLYKGGAADIMEELNGWYHVTSGSVEGYVKAEYCVTGQAAYELAQTDYNMAAIVLIDGLRVRRKPSQQGTVISSANKGDTLTLDSTVESPYGWVAVTVNGSTGYVAEKFVDVAESLGEAVSIEEEQAAIKQQEEEAARQAAAKQAAQEAAAKEAAQQAAQTAAPAVTQNESVAASVDDATLLAAIIQCEAGGECYEGQVAVGAVVMNRVRSGSYPSTISGVVYQKGQFTPAGSGKLAQVLSSGVNSSCMQAAQEALAGTDNTGGALFFRRASSGHSGYVIGNHVFY